eukprot:symbB.v1.2.040544.t1/scaffold7319.1/size11937/1
MESPELGAQQHLAQSMSKPALKAWTELRHLVQYLLGCTEFGLMMHYRSLIALSSAEAETYAATSGACDALFLSRCLEYLLEVTIGIKLLIDNSACRYILSRAGCGRVRHLSTRILWMQQRVERKDLMVGPVASSENVADIGTKRLAVSTMKYLMYKLGVYDSETSSLVGHEEFQMRTSKQNLRIITGTSNFKFNAHLIRLIVANSLGSSDALSCGTEDSAMDMSWVYWFGIEGLSANFLKPLYMQLSYIIEVLYVYISMAGVVFTPFSGMLAWMHGFAYWIGWICIGIFFVCLFCRLRYGPEGADSTFGRVLVLLGDAIVYNFFDDEETAKCGETASQKEQRYKNCSLSQCSDPELWQSYHRFTDNECDSDDNGYSDSMADSDCLPNYITSGNSALRRAQRGYATAELQNDQEMMYHYENILQTLSML